MVFVYLLVIAVVLIVVAKIADNVRRDRKKKIRRAEIRARLDKRIRENP